VTDVSDDTRRGAATDGRARLARLMDGYLTTQLLYVAAKLGVADALAAGRFALTPLGTAMRAGVAGSLRGPIIVRGEVYQPAAAGLLDAIRHGGTAFEYVYGERFFEHLDHHAEHEAAFQGSMAGRAENEAADVVAAYDFGALNSVVDVGGGEGVLLEAVVRSTAHLSATLVDRPAVLARA
jgi:O-methyltransferase domain